MRGWAKHAYAIFAKLARTQTDSGVRMRRACQVFHDADTKLDWMREMGLPDAVRRVFEG